MARSKGVIISVKVPINWEVMTKRKQQRLRQITGRDTRTIRAFLGIIEQYEDKLLTGRYKTRINESELDKLTMTAVKVKQGANKRLAVLHDMKDKFLRISQNELNECRQTAVSLYESYLQKRSNNQRVSRPCSKNQEGRIPRFVFSRRFKIIEHRTAFARWWVDLRDSLDSYFEERKVHARLLVPLKMSLFHLKQLNRGEVKALKIFKDKSSKWWIILAVRVDTPISQSESLPVAVLGVDLGIEKAACTALVTPTKVRETRYFVQKEKVQVIKKYDQLVASLQHEIAIRNNKGLQYDRIILKLRKIRNKRDRVAKEYDRVLVAQLRTYIEELSKRYTLYIAVGRLKHIRERARRGNYKGRRFRGMIHRWAFSRITTSLQHQLTQLGWTVEGKSTRFRVVPENWTSIMCWKCGRKGRRPKQNYFVCPTCGHKTNADRNGAINIAGRLIKLTKSLHSVRGLGKWADSVTTDTRLLPKTQGKFASRGRSLLSSKGHVSDLGESAAVHFVQSDLTSFSDGTSESDNDPAVEKSVETHSVVGHDTPTQKQETETRTGGGIVSQ